MISAGRKLKLTDFHTHILPGIDDGSRSTEMTAAMLQEEKRQGVERIIATPHFYANRMSVDSFLSHRAKALAETERIRAEAVDGMPEILAGAEVYYFPGIGEAEMIPRMCIEGTKTMLLEMPFEQWNEQVLRDVMALGDRGLKIVLAHIERYTAFQKDRKIWDRVMGQKEIRKQINAGSFLKEKGLGAILRGSRKRRFCLETLRENEDTVIGSDCHNTTSRAVNLLAAREVIRAELGEERLRKLDSAAEDALRDG